MFRGDAGLARGLDLVVEVLCVVDLVVSLSFVIDPVGLLGEEDREDDWDFDFTVGSLDERGNE